MKRTGLALALLMVFGVLAMVDTAHAQRRRPYTMSKPTFSPAFDLFRTGNAGIPTYHQFVRPRVEYERNRQVQENRLNKMERSFNQSSQTTSPWSGAGLTNRSATFGQSYTGARNSLPTAGTPSHTGAFMDYSHFYQGRQQVFRNGR